MKSNPYEKFFLTGYLALAWMLLLSILIQIFLAGMATFGDPAHWTKHAAFVHWFEFIPILMLIAAYLGLLPKPLRWQSAGLIVLLLFQYATAHIPYTGALHPVIAMLLFWQTAVVIRKGNEHLRKLQKRRT